VDLVDQLPVGVFHLVEGLVTQDAGVVHHHVDAPEAVHGLLDDFLAIGHRVMVGHCAAAGLADLRHHAVSRRGIGALAMSTATQVVDHYLGAQLGKQQGMGAPQAAAGTGDNYHFVVKTHGITHHRPSRSA